MEYNVLSAWVSRYYTEKSTSQFELSLSDMPSELTWHQKSFLAGLVTSSEPTHSKVEYVDLQDNKIIDYFKNLPFPWNIKCLSEILIPGTKLNSHFNTYHGSDTGELISYEAQREIAQNLVLRALERCNRKALKELHLNRTPEIAVILGHPELKAHIAHILHLFHEERLTPESKKWARKNSHKQKVREFVNAISDEEIRRQYYVKMLSSPVSDFMQTKTYCESLAAIPGSLLREIFKCVSSKPEDVSDHALSVLDEKPTFSSKTKH